jgi:hypothetical protein
VGHPAIGAGIELKSAFIPDFTCHRHVVDEHGTQGKKRRLQMAVKASARPQSLL